MFTYLLMSVLVIVPLWKIFDKVGQNPAYSLISLIPMIGFVICLAILAYSDWSLRSR